MPSLWSAETNQQKYPPLQEDKTCDLLVVESGIAGLPFAMRMKIPRSLSTERLLTRSIVIKAEKPILGAAYRKSVTR